MELALNIKGKWPRKILHAARLMKRAEKLILAMTRRKSQAGSLTYIVQAPSFEGCHSEELLLN